MDSSSTESRLPEIRELAEGPSHHPDAIITAHKLTKSMNLDVHTPTTPRIDISRASSSSQHEDSRDSSPENVFEQVIKAIS